MEQRAVDRPAVLVTPRSLSGSAGAAYLDPLRREGFEVRTPTPGRQPEAAELIDALPGCVGWVAGVEPIGADVLAAADMLQVISRNGSGADAIDPDAASTRGITVLTTPGANAGGVAELAVCLVLCSLRDVVPSAVALKDGRWERTTGREAAGRTIGIVGFGAIGRHVAALTGAMGMRRLVTDPVLDDTDLDEDIEALELDALLGASDVVTLHAPAAPDGPLLDRRRIGLLAPGAVLVNTARAGLVDENAVLAALDAGQLAAYAVDAFHIEPPPRSALLDHPRVLATPHIGAATEESQRRAATAAVANLLTALTTPPPAGPTRSAS